MRIERTAAYEISNHLLSANADNANASDFATDRKIRRHDHTTRRHRTMGANATRERRRAPCPGPGTSDAGRNCAQLSGVALTTNPTKGPGASTCAWPFSHRLKLNPNHGQQYPE